MDSLNIWFTILSLWGKNFHKADLKKKKKKKTNMTSHST